VLPRILYFLFFLTHPSASRLSTLSLHDALPISRVLIANSNLVGRWASWEVFRDLEKKGLVMYGQMTAGSWIYIGTQGIHDPAVRSEEHTSELQSRGHLVCRLLLEKKKKE